MIVREIKDDPDKVLENFDWFNDYTDTLRWCESTGLTEIADRMRKGFDWTKELTREQINECIRSSGDCFCPICGREYWKHPMEDRVPSGIDGRPFLHRACDGTLLKL